MAEALASKYGSHEAACAAWNCAFCAYSSGRPRFEQRVPETSLQSPSIALPTEKAWDAAKALVRGTSAESKFIDHDSWVGRIGAEGYADFNAESEELEEVPESRLENMLANPEFPTVLIADDSPLLRRASYFGDLLAIFGNRARILRVTWPAQLFLHATENRNTFVAPGSVWTYFPQKYRDDFGVEDIRVTQGDIAKEVAGTLYEDVFEEDPSYFWKEKFGKQLDRAFIPCTEMLPEYFELRSEAARLLDVRRLAEEEQREQERARIREIRGEQITWWDENGAKVQGFERLQASEKELFELYEGQVARNKELERKLGEAGRRIEAIESSLGRPSDSLRGGPVKGSEGGDFSLKPVWSFARAELDGPFPFSNASLPTVIEKLKAYESLTWSELKRQRSHPVKTELVSKGARDRLTEIGLGEEAWLYSFRVNAEERIWGLRRGNVIQVLWWDPEHRVCPSSLKHT